MLFFEYLNGILSHKKPSHCVTFERMNNAQFSGYIGTHPLWIGRQLDVHQFELPNVKIKSFPLINIPANLRLGHQMEYVFKHIIEHTTNYNMAIYNLPIRQEGITLGEIDFILEDKIHGKLIHVETTYKFYIINLEISEPIHQLIGPNKKDSFFDKMQKIKNKQFPLLHNKTSAYTLSEINIDHNAIEHQCCFKSQLFQPYGHNNVDIGTFNRNCIVGYWLRMDDFIKREFANSQYYIPSKSEWVVEAHDDVSWKSHDEIITDIKHKIDKEKSPMIWLKRAQAIEKIFVVWW